MCESLLKLPKVSWNLKLTHYKIEILIQKSDYNFLLILCYKEFYSMANYLMRSSEH